MVRSPIGNRSGPAPADLEIVISIQEAGSKAVFEYELHSPSGIAPFEHEIVRGPDIVREPAEFCERLMNRLDKLNQQLDVDGGLLLQAEISEKLAGIGRDLYRMLFTKEMKYAYRQFRELVKTIQIVTDDPWIPWEILRPYDDSDQDPARLVDDDFLCCRFQVTRWLAGARDPADELRIEQLSCIYTGEVSGEQGIACSSAERQLLVDLASTHGLRDASPSSLDQQALLGSLAEGGSQILHFVGHGEFNSKEPEAAKLFLPDKSYLRAEDLHGPLASRLSRDRPLVFVNACCLGRRGEALTGLDGWPERFVRHIGCGAFIAPLWAVRSSQAFEFARSFYASLEADETIGSAALAARLKVREIARTQSTWLAYVVYAHPNAKLSFPAGKSIAESPNFSYLQEQELNSK